MSNTTSKVLFFYFFFMKSRELCYLLSQTYTNTRSLDQIHCQILKNGLTHHVFLNTKLVSSYSKLGPLETARKLFDEIPQRNLNVFLWNTILRSYGREQLWNETLHLFHQMQISGFKPDNFTLPIALKACTGLSTLSLEIGKQIHGFIEKSVEIDSDMFIGAGLIEFYSKCGKMKDAHQVFVSFSQPDVVLWTSMVSGYQQNGYAEEALMVFSRMLLEFIVPDPVTLISVISACTQNENFKLGKCCHGYILRRGLDSYLSLVNSLLNLYAKVSLVEYARNMFDKMPKRDVISWSSMIAGYAQNEQANEALTIFNEMIVEGLEPNSITVVSALQACAVAGDLLNGRKIHEFAIRKGFELKLAVSTAILDMYIKCSCFEEAHNLFQRMPEKDVVSWAAMISGYARNGLAHLSLGVFQHMLLDDTLPDAVVIVKILTSCSQLGILQQALCLHGYLIGTGFEDKVFVSASLIDLYSKCGSLDNAVKVFEKMVEKDVVVWSSMIAGFGIHGQGGKALRTFDRMLESSIKPNHITYVSVLSACSHSGLIEEGWKIFYDMLHGYEIVPNLEHYACMVDLLGRTGELDKAVEFINRMPVRADSQVWGALLGACRIHHNIELGEFVASHLFELEQNHSGYYVLMSNIYADGAKWDRVAKVRSLMKEKGVEKRPGCSSIEVGNVVHTFLVGDKLHPESEKICSLLRELSMKMRREGYVSDTSFVCHDVDEEIKGRYAWIS